MAARPTSKTRGWLYNAAGDALELYHGTTKVASLVSGGLTFDSGGLTLTDTGLTVTAGGITVTSGNVLLTAGNLTLTCGNFVQTAGCFTVPAGNIAGAALADGGVTGAKLAAASLKMFTITGGSAGCHTVTGIAAADHIVSVFHFTPGACTQTFADLTSEFVPGAGKITNACGTATCCDTLFGLYINDA